ncbi:MAG: 4Fe-4S dicluster domain-containing protein [Thermodesulfobacteriota bacterium]
MESAAYRAFDDVDRPSPRLIDDCVHCGFCLSACPTYLETGSEMDSPRGRIYLMKSAGEGKIPLEGSLVEHLDKCLRVPRVHAGVSVGRAVREPDRSGPLADRQALREAAFRKALQIANLFALPVSRASRSS